MNPSDFITAAYGIAAILLALLCLTTWLRARRATTQIAEQKTHEA